MSALIEINNLRYRWRQDLPDVLHIPHWQVSQGDRVFIRGASGSGKSTLLSLLAGVLVPSQGEIQVLEKPIHQLSGSRRDHFRSDHIGFVFQQFNLIPYLSVLDNVTLPCRFSHKRKQKVLSNGISLEDEAMRLLDHLEMAQPDLVNRSVTELSVGQQQRVATARALMGSPEILIADEPTSALDSDRRESFIQLLFKECDTTQSTLLFVSHDRQLETLFENHVSMSQLNQLEQGQA